jgi:Tfp pilus assembly protein PilF
VHATQARQPGQASSGSIAQSQAVLIEEQLGEAQTFMQQNQTLKALELYDKVLAEDPRDPNALANAGWLEWKSAFGQPGTAKVLADGRKKIETSIRLAPSDYEGHKYLGVILTQYGDATGAQKQFAQFLADDPPAGEIEAEASLITGVYQKVGVPLPSALRSTTTTTSRP